MDLQEATMLLISLREINSEPNREAGAGPNSRSSPGVRKWGMSVHWSCPTCSSAYCTAAD